MNAIIIDDHPLARIAIRNLLDSNGITVAAELDSGAHAVQTAESMQPDLLIVDVDIPELSGIEVLEQLRKRRYFVNRSVFSTNLPFSSTFSSADSSV